MSAIEKLAKKYRRALRNGGGANFTAEELRALANIGALALIQAPEEAEIKAAWAPIEALMGQPAVVPSAPQSSPKPAGRLPKIDRATIAAMTAKL